MEHPQTEEEVLNLLFLQKKKTAVNLPMAWVTLEKLSHTFIGASLFIYSET